MNKDNLTKKQEKVFKLIGEYFEGQGESPTIPELRDMLGVKSLRTVTQYLEILERKGFIYRKKNEKRGIKPIGYKAYFNPEMINIQIYGSAGCDNQSIFAEPIHDEYVVVSKQAIKNKKGEVAAIKAMGRSMTGAGIEDGDIVLVERTKDVKNNDRVVAIIDDMAVIKRISFTKTAVILNPDSREEGYKPIIMKRDFEVVGKIIDVIKAPKEKEENEIEIIPVPEQNY